MINCFSDPVFRLREGWCLIGLKLENWGCGGMGVAFVNGDQLGPIPWFGDL